MELVPDCDSPGDAGERRSGCDIEDENVRSRCLVIVGEAALFVGEGADEVSDGKGNFSLERLARGGPDGTKLTM